MECARAGPIVITRPMNVIPRTYGISLESAAVGISADDNHNIVPGDKDCRCCCCPVLHCSSNKCTDGAVCREGETELRRMALAHLLPRKEGRVLSALRMRFDLACSPKFVFHSWGQENLVDFRPSISLSLSLSLSLSSIINRVYV